MIKFEQCEIVGWEHAIRGMRNPLNSWDKTDTGWRANDLTRDDNEPAYSDEDVLIFGAYYDYVLGENDKTLMMKLRNAGTDHRKFMRMITVYVDITAPLYW